MLRKLLTVVCLAAVSGAAFISIGCASSNAQPSSLTGDQTVTNDNWRYVDQKGHYRPEMRQQYSGASMSSDTTTPSKG